MPPLTQEKALSLLGKAPSDVAGELKAYSDTARVLSSQHVHLMEEHPHQWVGLYDGGVKVFGKTLISVLAQIEAQGIPKEEAIVRYIDKDEKTLIL